MQTAVVQMMQVLEYSRVVHPTNRTWMYVACAAEYYYYTTTLVKNSLTDKNVDLKKWTWPNLGGSSDRSDPHGYGPVTSQKAEVGDTDTEAVHAH